MNQVDGPLRPDIEQRLLQSAEIHRLNDCHVKIVSLQELTQLPLSENKAILFKGEHHSVRELQEDDRNLVATQLKKFLSENADNPIVHKIVLEPDQVKIAELIWLVNQLCWDNMVNGDSTLKKGESLKNYFQGKTTVVACNTFDSAFYRVYEELSDQFPHLKDSYHISNYTPDFSLNTWNENGGNFAHAALMVYMLSSEGTIAVTPIDPYRAKSKPENTVPHVLELLDMSKLSGPNAITQLFRNLDDNVYLKDKVDLLKQLTSYETEEFSLHDKILFLANKVHVQNAFIRSLLIQIELQPKLREDQEKEAQEYRELREERGYPISDNEHQEELHSIYNRFLSLDEQNTIKRIDAEQQAFFSTDLKNILDQVRNAEVGEKILIGASLMIALQVNEFWKMTSEQPSLLAEIMTFIRDLASADITVTQPSERSLIKSAVLHRKYDSLKLSTGRYDVSALQNEEYRQSLTEIKDIFERISIKL